ncbi:hypothetical protein [Streptomyces alboniger]|uniref:Lipoprotein n=1 Tax=Streptomyces alboniger TaxID=132473 RepID=A0A5J6HK02_STRAD|nr:hypothetical protein [Streptomyces alboniger]QEV19778.1 hypothetical protein CP975_21730 [Streptomyces alboniger]
MHRPTRLVTTAALTVSAAVLLTACGSGGGDGGSSDKIEGADGGGGAPASASAEASRKPGGAKRPEVELPSGFEADFVGWTSGDPKKQAILDDGREELRAKYAAIIEADPDADAVAFYDTGASLATARKWIKSFVETDDSLIGEIKAYNAKAHVTDDGAGVLFYCVDERKSATKNRRTGKVTRTPDSPESVLQYRARLTKSPQGVWQTAALETVPGGCK